MRARGGERDAAKNLGRAVRRSVIVEDKTRKNLFEIFTRILCKRSTRRLVAGLGQRGGVMRKSRTFRRCDGVRPMRRWLISAVGVILAVAAIGLAPARLAAAPGDREHEGAELGPGC